ncbi:MAG: hypothetical protein V1735_01640 [Nanoarchaeota archaeon]
MREDDILIGLDLARQPLYGKLYRHYAGHDGFREAVKYTWDKGGRVFSMGDVLEMFAELGQGMPYFPRNFFDDLTTGTTPDGLLTTTEVVTDGRRYIIIPDGYFIHTANKAKDWIPGMRPNPKELTDLLDERHPELAVQRFLMDVTRPEGEPPPKALRIDFSRTYSSDHNGRNLLAAFTTRAGMPPNLFFSLTQPSLNIPFPFFVPPPYDRQEIPHLYRLGFGKGSVPLGDNSGGHQFGFYHAGPEDLGGFIAVNKQTLDTWEQAIEMYRARRLENRAQASVRTIRDRVVRLVHSSSMPA